MNQYTLTLTGDGHGGVAVDGVAQTLPWSGAYEYGATVTVEALADAGYGFTGWSGALSGSTNPATITITGDTDSGAAFAVNRYTLTLTGDGHGSVIVDGVAQALPWSGTFDSGAVVEVEAQADADYGFLNWTGDLLETANPISVTMDGDKSLAAHFLRSRYTLHLAGSGGQVMVDGVAVALPVQLTRDQGDEVTLDAAADSCTLFLGWSGDASGRDNPLVVVMDADKTITANFVSMVFFSDVGCDYWAVREIAVCHLADIVQGYGDGTYRPNLVVTRDQMAVYISRALAGGDANVPTAPATASFPDVPTNQWAFKYIEYAKAQGIVQGYWDGYHPERSVDRAQMAVYVSRAICSPTGEAGLAGYTPPATPTFPDVPTDFWAYKHIEYAHARSVVYGYWDGYRPDTLVTRDQMAVYVARAFDLLR